MMIRIRARIVSCWILASTCICFAFTPPLSTCSRRKSSRFPSPAVASRTICQSSLNSEIFLLSFDGTVAETTEYRIEQGIDVCLATWPHLRELDIIAGQQQQSENSDDNNSWLKNKMRAVSQVLVSRPGVSLTCDYALLARLLLEEQELDQGRSNGCNGKYGSKFHPQTQRTSSSSSSDSARTSSSSSRPLTVGEICSNWNKGGCLSDTLLTKYHADYNNPLPILQEKLEKLSQDSAKQLPKINNAVLDVLPNSCGNIIVTVGHESELELAQKTLSLAFPEACIVPIENGNIVFDRDDSNSFTIQLLPIHFTHRSCYNDIMDKAPSGTTIYIFGSSWDALEQGIFLFDDNIPRRGSGVATTTPGRDLKLSLNFPKWTSTKNSFSSSASPTHGGITVQNEALMNPWTNLVSEREFLELLSARTVC